MWINDNCPHGNFPPNFTALNRNHFHWIVGCHFFWNTSLLHGLWLLYIRKSLFQRKIQHTCSYIQFSHSVMSDCLWPHRPACQDSLSITNSQSLLKLMSIESVLPSNHLILCHPLLLLPSILTSIRVFSNESVLCLRWPKYWSFIFNINPSNEYSELISFRID